MSEKFKKFLKNIWQWTYIIIIAVILFYVVNVFVFERAQVDGSSMMPTLRDGESLFEYKTGYLFNEPERGDVVVFEHNVGRFESKYMPIDFEQENYVKRVIGLPGETIDIVDGNVYINEKLLVEPYLNNGTITDLSQQQNVVDLPEVKIDFPYTIPEGEYFVMGDNREYSLDSRSIGSISKERIRGKVLFVMFPISEIRTLNVKPYVRGMRNK